MITIGDVQGHWYRGVPGASRSASDPGGQLPHYPHWSRSSQQSAGTRGLLLQCPAGRSPDHVQQW